MDQRAEADADDHVRPDPPDDVERGAPGVAHAVVQRRPEVDVDAPGADLPDVVLDVALEAQAADQEPREDGDDEPGGHVGDGELRPDEAPEEDDRHLVDHGRRDKERDAGLEEADEQRHRRARAERRDDPEARGGGRPDDRVPTRERRPDLFRRDERAQERDEGDDPGEEQQNLGHVEQEEGDGLAELGRLVEPQDVEGDPGRERQREEPGDEPERPSDQDRDP